MSIDSSTLGPEGRVAASIDLNFGRYRTVMNAICQYYGGGLSIGHVANRKDNPL
jgi:hypothetical protein